MLLLFSVLSASAYAAPQYGQLFVAYYSGVGIDTLGSGGVNALALAFFDPTPMGKAVCDFTSPTTPCIIPATGSGESKNLGWALKAINESVVALSGNTSPKRGGKPTIFFSFGGESQGGACWDSIFGNSASAKMFAQNAAKLVTTVYDAIGQKAYVGIDLDIEGTSSTLPNINIFVTQFRQMPGGAAYDTFPLQLCALSGLASNTSMDHFKVGIFQKLGPTQGGFNFLNMMVNNVDSSCTTMSTFWRDPTLDFIPPENKILGVWGEITPSWVLHGPGCTDGNNPLFPWIQKNGVGIGIWQWWTGATTDITALINQIRS